jgi:hypothetical protein
MQALLVEAADGNQQVASQAKLIYSFAVPGCLSRIRLFSIPNPGSEFFPPRTPDRHQKIVF